MSEKLKRIKIRGDRVIWAVVIILSILSLLAVYSSSGSLAYRYRQGNVEYFLFKQLIILGTGLVLMYIVHHFYYRKLKSAYGLLLLSAIVLMIGTWIYGISINEAPRWIKVPGIPLTFQPSEIAKLAVVIYLAFMLKKEDVIQGFPHILTFILFPVILICGLIFFADFSTAVLLFATAYTMIFISKINWRYTLSIAGGALAVIAIVVILAYTYPEFERFGTWKERIEAFMHPEGEDNYQVEQAKIAIATGGVVGKLPGNSTQRNFLPQAYSDFIFAIIIEEYGLVGGGTVVLLYLILFYRAIRIVTKLKEKLPSYLVIGLSFMVVFQALLNMAVATNFLPVTGQPLPMVSMGGTSIWFTSIAIGIILNISREIDEKEPGKNISYA
ncbi:MAG: FtsW/RodA/SpoVE family cell cycle protein [Bacteroidales bacterium]|nr:FtsW/RodA/SpoVE family cell cycle protein [Bacteroidales bacterium]